MSSRSPSTGEAPSPVKSLVARWPGWLGVVAGVLMVGALVKYRFIEGDTHVMLDTLDGVLRCVSEGRWVRCDEAGKWPVFQYAPSVLLRGLGVSRDRVGDFLACLSIAAFVGLLGITWRTLASRSRPVAIFALLVLGSGLFLHYANRSFGEMVAAFFAVALAASWLRRRGVGLVALLAFLTSLTKETAFPFIGLLGVTCVLARRTPGQSWRSLLREERGRLVGTALGVALGVAVSAGVNYFRFGVPYNAAYLEEATMAPPVFFQLDFFAALWVAPNAGLLFFWPLLVLTLLALPVAVWRRGRRSGTATDWLPLRVLEVMLVLLTAFLARWWAPFGWWAWGSRLILPWMPAVLLMALYVYAEDARELVRPLVASRARVVGLVVVVSLLALPHVASIFLSNEVINTAFASRGVCITPDTPERYAEFFPCLHDTAWVHPSPLLHGYRLVPHRHVRLRALLVVLLVACAGAWLWRESREPARS